MRQTRLTKPKCTVRNNSSAFLFSVIPNIRKYGIQIFSTYRKRYSHNAGKIGISSLKELYADVPDSIMFKGEYNIDEAKSEIEIRNYFKQLCEKNKLLTVFAGAAHTTITLRL